MNKTNNDKDVDHAKWEQGYVPHFLHRLLSVSYKLQAAMPVIRKEIVKRAYQQAKAMSDPEKIAEIEARAKELGLDELDG